MMELEEQKIKPPKVPLTKAINQAITDFYFDHFMSNNIPPGVAWVITSKTRSKADNDRVGGAANSAHLHGLALDFILMRGDDPLSPGEMKSIWKERIDPNWQGYTYVSDKHIHVNLSRKIGHASGLLAVSVIGLVGISLFSKFKNKRK